MSVNRFGRLKGSLPRERGRMSVGLLAVTLGALLLAALPAWAGSIFMKNGYIIQGPIVEHSDGVEGSVVLGWPNGKMVVFRRFIDRVDFEAGEERNSKAAVAQTTEAPEEVITSPAMDVELPSSLSDFVRLNNLPQALIESTVPHGVPVEPGPAQGGETATGTPPPGGDLVPDVAVIPKPPEVQPPTPVDVGTGEDLLAPRAADPKWGFSIQPPKGWKAAEVEGCLSWTGPAGSDGFSASMNIASIAKKILKWQDACTVLKEDQKIPFTDYQLQGEESLELSGSPAFRVKGTGRAQAPAGARKVFVRQTLVEKGDRLWLLSAFVGDGTPERLAEVIEKSIGTFQIHG